MVKLRLMCAIVGERSAFEEEVDDGDSVCKMKDKVREQNANKLEYVDAPELQLFLARTTTFDGWLKWSSAASVARDDDGTLRDHKDSMSGTRVLKRYFGADFHPGEGEVHVLVVVPKGKNIRELFAIIREDRVRLERLERRVEESAAALKHKESKFGSVTDEELGQTTRQRLEKHELISELAPMGDGEAFWSEKEPEHVDGMTTEADFVAFITPFSTTFYAAVVWCSSITARDIHAQERAQVLTFNRVNLRPTQGCIAPGQPRNAKMVIFDSEKSR